MIRAIVPALELRLTHSRKMEVPGLHFVRMRSIEK